MINELYSLARTLESQNIEVIDWQREYIPLPCVTKKSPCVRLWLDDDGAICGFEHIDAELASKLRKYGNKHGSFPAFNVAPLYRLTDKKQVLHVRNYINKKEKPNLELIRSWCIVNNWVKDADEHVHRCLIKHPESMLELAGKSADGSIIAKLAELCKKLTTSNDGGFRGSLERCILNSIEKGEEIELAFAMLFSEDKISENSQDKDAGKKLSVFLDVKDWQKYGYPVASEYTTLKINDLLVTGENVRFAATSKIIPGAVDAFGSPFSKFSENMPSVMIGSLQEVKLRTMYDDKKCQLRYGKIKDGSYPISKDNRTLVTRALVWVSLPENEDVTWTKVDINELAFAYPSKLPEIMPKFVSIFGNKKDADSQKAQARFEKSAESFIRVFRGLPPEQKPEQIQLFNIKKIDDARSKVIFSHNTAPELLICAADDWQKGCSNLPPVDIGETETPYPLETADIVNAVWEMDGSRADGKTPVKRMKYYQGTELLLDLLPSDVQQSLLHVLIENTAGLFGYLGSSLHGRTDLSCVSQRLAAAHALPLLGLLLYKRDIRKDDYMEDLAYLLGQLLHVSDELHVLYCMVKRDGSIPPQLAGAALFTTAGETPYQALAVLAARMNPYISWAKQYRFASSSEKGRESWRAGWLLGLFEMLSDKVAPRMDKALRFGDYEKAQLFIGYMASLPSIKKDHAANGAGKTGDDAETSENSGDGAAAEKNNGGNDNV